MALILFDLDLVLNLNMFFASSVNFLNQNSLSKNLYILLLSHHFDFNYVGSKYTINVYGKDKN
jgi:hypothetical protein